MQELFFQLMKKRKWRTQVIKMGSLFYYFVGYVLLVYYWIYTAISLADVQVLDNHIL